jgi:enoyl-CoA hydratase
MPDGTSSAQADRYETIKVETAGRVGLVHLHRPKNLNALNAQLSLELLDALRSFDQDEAIGVMIVTGSERAFAAGADIEEMARKTPVQLRAENYFGALDEIARLSKPIIAAVSGYALGGGCELALLCDIIIAADNAQFGQPEIKLGIQPGIGGSQRLTRAVGKSLAMELILTGRMMPASEAKAAGMVASVVPQDGLMQEALRLANTIAEYNSPAVRSAKEAVNRAYETSLAEGILHERRLFQAAFATEGQREGMNAFLEKRAPAFSHR